MEREERPSTPAFPQLGFGRAHAASSRTAWRAKLIRHPGSFSRASVSRRSRRALRAYLPAGVEHPAVNDPSPTTLIDKRASWTGPQITSSGVYSAIQH